MGKHLLIVIPTKTGGHYDNRAKACLETWLKDCPCDYKFFSDADLGLTEINQHDNANDPIRTWRTKLMVKYAYDNGYEFVFRVDTDAYVWINRLLNSGFEQYDYMGWCNSPRPFFSKWCMTTAHGGIGFFLSRKAMEVVMNAPVDKYADGKYWGDLWAGQKLHEAGIECHRDTRFIDGTSPYFTSKGNISPDKLPLDHQFISIHPVDPIQNFYDLHAAFPAMSDETTPPERIE